MSEYQYYEFRAIDRPLSEAEQREIGKLSSRVDLTPSKAVFVYNYGDFRGDPEEVLSRYFDASLYLANWGSRRLMFRFPKAMIDLEEVRPYCVTDHISFSVAGEHVILDIELDKEEGVDWLEGEGWLPSLLGLREDILRQDYRLLYLAWLGATMLVYDLDEDAHEPPVPPGLRAPSAALGNFVDLFELDKDLLKVAAQASGERQEVSQETLQQALSRLPEAERDAFLLRLARGEANLSAALNRRLYELAGVTRDADQPERTVKQLRRAAEGARAEEKKKRAQEAERQRLKALSELSQREEQVWQEVDGLIRQKQAKAYEEAVGRLLRLRDLAACKEKKTAFEERLRRLREQHSRLPALQRRLDKAGL